MGGDLDPPQDRRSASRFTRWRVRGDCGLSPLTLLGLALLAGLSGGVGVWLLTGRAGLAVIDAGLLFAVPWAWRRMAARSRLKRFQAQLPDAIELIAGAIRAGHSLAAGFHLVAENMPPPIGREFRTAYEDQNLGVPLEEALQSMCGRVGSLELRLLVTSVAIQRQTGGDLGTILRHVGSLIRDRSATLGHAGALTSAVRFNATLIASLPPVALLLAAHVRPGAVDQLWAEADGIRPGLVALAAWGLGLVVAVRLAAVRT